MSELVLDIYDSTILDSRPVTRDELIVSLGFKTRSAISHAVKRGLLPPPADRDGPRGQARWFVGQLRRWNARKCAEAMSKEDAHTGCLRESIIPDPDEY